MLPSIWYSQKLSNHVGRKDHWARGGSCRCESQLQPSSWAKLDPCYVLCGFFLVLGASFSSQRKIYHHRPTLFFLFRFIKWQCPICGKYWDSLWECGGRCFQRLCFNGYFYSPTFKCYFDRYDLGFYGSLDFSYSRSNWFIWWFYAFKFIRSILSINCLGFNGCFWKSCCF